MGFCKILNRDPGSVGFTECAVFLWGPALALAFVDQAVLSLLPAAVGQVLSMALAQLPWHNIGTLAAANWHKVTRPVASKYLIYLV